MSHHQSQQVHENLLYSLDRPSRLRRTIRTALQQRNNQSTCTTTPKKHHTYFNQGVANGIREKTKGAYSRIPECSNPDLANKHASPTNRGQCKETANKTWFMSNSECKKCPSDSFKQSQPLHNTEQSDPGNSRNQTACRVCHITRRWPQILTPCSTNTSKKSRF
jgi:hypothetical protein